jgi:large subunit ribosomal protein L31
MELTEKTYEMDGNIFSSAIDGFTFMVDKYFMIGSTLKTDRTIEWQDGKTYPYFTVEVSAESHPYYTGKQRVIQKEGRVANFNRRFAQFTKE